MNVAEYVPVNWELLKNPYNWVILALMVIVGGLALSLLFPTSEGNAP